MSPIWRLYCAFFVLSLLGSPVICDEYPIPWESVPLTNDGVGDSLPVGCTCVDTSGGVCVKFECPCVCDLTFGQCDINCCCDGDCTADQKALFDGANMCLPEGPAPSRFTKCIDLEGFNELVEVNPKYNMKIDKAREIDRMLCVAIDNSPIVGTFLTDPGNVSPQIFQTETVAAQLVYEQPTRTLPEAPVSSQTSYGVGDALIDDSLNPIRIPVPGPSGLCANSGVLKFGVNIPTSKCYSVVPNWDDDTCAALSLAALPTEVIASRPYQPTYISIKLISVSNLDPSTGTISLVAAGPSLDYSLFNQSVNDAGACTCTNAVLQADYVVSMASPNVISSVSLSVVLADLSTGCATASVPRTFSVTYQSSGATDGLVYRSKSGNPGYLAGSIIRAGTSVTNSSTGSTAIAEHKDGLQLVVPKGSSGACTMSSTQSIPVTMGTTLSYACTLSLTLNDLRDTACKWQVPPYISLNATHVGEFGNADPTRIWQWVQIANATTKTPQSGAWRSAALACESMPVGLNIRVLTADVGELGNPQRKIVAIQKAYSLDTWQFTQPSPTTPQTFAITATISFLNLPDKGLEDFEPSLPPSFPKLPHDLFYPFWLGSA